MAKFGIGDSVRRVEDPRLLTGGGRYTDDTKLSAPAARLYVLRSPHAHADIKGIDTAAAKKAPGVLLVLHRRGREEGRLRRRALPGAARQPRRHAARRHQPADAGPGPRAPCRRSGGAGRRRDARAGQGRLRADRGRLRSRGRTPSAPANRRSPARRWSTTTSRTTSSSTGRWATRPRPTPPSRRPTRS